RGLFSVLCSWSSGLTRPLVAATLLMKLVDPLAPFLRALPAVVFGRGGLAGLLANALEGRNLFLVVPGFGVVGGWLARIHCGMVPPNSWHKKATEIRWSCRCSTTGSVVVGL